MSYSMLRVCPQKKGFSESEPTDIRKSGDNSREDPPVSIPNTEVKLSSAEDTWREAAWEIRTSPVFSFIRKKECITRVPIRQ